MAYQQNYSLAYKASKKKPVTKGVATTNMPAKTSRARESYIKTLGFTPKDMPEFRSERPKPKGIMKVFDVLDRARSGVAAGMNQIYTEDIAKSKKTGRSMGSVNAERTLKNIGPLGLRNIKYLPTMIEGAKGDTNFTGKSLVSRYYDDPHVRKQITPGQAKIVDNKYYRGGVGFATDIMADPTNLIPLGAITKPVKYVSKATGLTNKVINPASKAIKGSHAVKGIIKTLGGGRDAKHLANIHRADTVAAMSAEIANFTKKATEGVISKGDKVKLVANVTGTVGMLTDEKNAIRVANKVSKAFDRSQAGMAKLKAMGVELDQKRLYEEMVGASTKVAKTAVDKIYKDIASLGRTLQDDVVTDLIAKTGKVSKEVLEKNRGEYLRGLYQAQDPGEYIKQIAQPRQGSHAFGAEIGLTKMKKNDALRVIEYIKKNPNPKYDDVVTRYELLTNLSKLAKYPKGAIIKDPDKLITTGLKTSKVVDDVLGTSGKDLFFTRKSLKHIAEKGEVGAKLIDALPDVLLSPDEIRRTGELGRSLVSKNIRVSKNKPMTTVVMELINTKDGIIVTILPNRQKYLEKFELLWRSPKTTSMSVPPSASTFQGLAGSRSDISALTTNQRSWNIIPNKNANVHNMNQVSNMIEPRLRELLGDDFKKFALEGRRSAGLVDEANLVLPESIEQGLRFASTDMMLTKTAEFAMDFPSESVAKAADFRLIPSTAKYGDLAGKYVPDVVFDDIVGLIEPGGGMMRQALNNWKKLKLFSPLNFAPNARNMISDMTANSLVEGGPSVIRQIALMPKAIDDYWKGGKYTKLLTEKGVFASKYASQEGRRQLASAMGKQADGGVMDLVTKAADKFTSKSLNTRIPGVGFGTEAYGYTSDIGKMVQIIHQVEKNGLSIDDAIKMADKATFDYSKLPVSLRKYRDNLMPFMTYKYFAAQLVWDTFINRTGKITKLTHARRAVEGLSEDKANERDLPQYMKDNRAFYFRLPGQFDDQQNNPRYLDMSYLLPMGDLGGTSPKDLVFGNPFVKTAVEFATNKSMFNDMPIVQDTDMPTEKAKKYALYLATQFGPSAPWMPNNQGDIKLLDAARGKENSQGNKMSLTYEAPARLAGIRTQEVNPKLQRKYNSYDKKDQITELNSKIKKVKKSDDDPETKKKKIARLKQQIKDIKNN